MSGADALLAGPWGPSIAIAAMALATLLCRVSGVVLMRFVRLTPRVEAGMAALPGSIVAATVAPLAIRAGPAGITGVLTAILVTKLVGNELVALAAGMAVASLIRAAGY